VTASHATIRLRYGADMDRETALRRLYAAFNARDIDTTLAGMTADVDWPNGWEGGYVKGHDEVRAYWTRQWEEVDSTAEPLAFSTRPDGRVEVRVHLVGRSPQGETLFDHEGSHVYTFQGDLVKHMSIE
jgi:hypothetical protein